MATFVTEMNLEQASVQVRQALVSGRSAMYQAATSFGLTPQNTPERVAALLKAWSGAVRAVRADVMASNAVRNAAEAQLRDDARQTLTDLKLAYGQALTAYKDNLTAPRLPLTADEHLVLWARVQRQLDAGVDLDAIVADADPAMLQVLADEVKAWRRSKMPGDVKSADQLADADRVRIDERRYELADPAQRQRIDRARAADKGDYRVRVTFAQAEHIVEHLDDFIGGDGLAREIILPQWVDGQELTFRL